MDPIDPRKRRLDSRDYDAAHDLSQAARDGARAGAADLRVGAATLQDFFDWVPSGPVDVTPEALKNAALRAPVKTDAPPKDACEDARPTLVASTKDLPRGTPTIEQLASCVRPGAACVDPRALEAARQKQCAETGVDPMRFGLAQDFAMHAREAPAMTQDEQLRAILAMTESMSTNPLAAMAYLYARGVGESLEQQRDTVGVADAVWGVAGGVGAAAAARVSHQAPKRDEPPSDAGGPLRKINGRKPTNGKYAWQSYPTAKLPPAVGAKYPAGVRFKASGFPDFAPYAVARIRLKKLTGGEEDLIRASQQAGFGNVPRPFDGRYTWHHVEDGETMLLVPRDLHQAVRHTGGAALVRQQNRGK